MGGILPRVNRPMLAVLAAVGLAPPRSPSLRRVQDVLTSRAATGSVKPGDKAGAHISQRRFGSVRATSPVSHTDPIRGSSSRRVGVSRQLDATQAKLRLA